MPFLSFPALIHIELLCGSAVSQSCSLGDSAMSRASLGRNQHHPLCAAPKAREQKQAQEHIFDAWPGYSTELSEAEIKMVVHNNRLAVVLREATRAVVISVGMVVGLLVLLTALGVR
jgi:hypothetical protein